MLSERLQSSAKVAQTAILLLLPPLPPLPRPLTLRAMPRPRAVKTLPAIAGPLTNRALTRSAANIAFDPLFLIHTCSGHRKSRAKPQSHLFLTSIYPIINALQNLIDVFSQAMPHNRRR